MYKLDKAGKFIEFKNGKLIKPGGEGDYPVYGANGIIGMSDEYREQNSVIIGRVGAYCGAVQYCKGRYWASDNTIVACPKDENTNVRFLYYQLRNANLNRWAGGAAQPLMTQTVIKQIELSYPNLDIQNKIASILSIYDDLIENNNRRIKILEQMVQVIYREWFVNFRFPGHEKTKFVDSELGKIPDRWEVNRLGEVIELAYGKALKAIDRKAGNIPVFGSSGIIGYHNNSIVGGPGIIVGRKGNVGSIFWSDSDFFPIDTVFYVKTKLSLLYVFYALQRMNFINNDAAVPGLNRNQAYLLDFIVPKKKIINHFENLITPILKYKRILFSKNDKLRESRDILLPKLISGEIDVSEMDIKIKELDNGT